MMKTVSTFLFCIFTYSSALCQPIQWGTISDLSEKDNKSSSIEMKGNRTLLFRALQQEINKDRSTPCALIYEGVRNQIKYKHVNSSPIKEGEWMMDTGISGDQVLDESVPIKKRTFEKGTPLKDAVREIEKTYDVSCFVSVDANTILYREVELDKDKSWPLSQTLTAEDASRKLTWAQACKLLSEKYGLGLMPEFDCDSPEFFYICPTNDLIVWKGTSESCQVRDLVMSMIPLALKERKLKGYYNESYTIRPNNLTYTQGDQTMKQWYIIAEIDPH